MTDSSHAGTGASHDEFDVLSHLLDTMGVGGSSSHIAPRADGATVPMSYSQELLWLLDRATPGMIAYNLPLVRRLRGPLDVAALERALTLLATRHESLRARFVEVDGAPRLLIDPPAPVMLRVLDVTGATSDGREADARRIARERGRTPFDLAQEHLFRPSLIRLAADDNILLLESHHIVLDGWSLAIVFRELSVAYDAFRSGKEHSLAPVKVGFGDFAIWQREHLGGERMRTLVEFWREQLAGATEPLGLPTDFPRTSVPTFAGGSEVLVLPEALTHEIQAFARRNDATPYMVLLAAYATVLSRYTGRENVLIGSGSAGRTLETEAIVGYLNNTLVQRADFSGDPTLGELLARVRASAIDAYDHQEIPLERLVQEMRGSTGASTAPLFDVVLTMEDTVPNASTFGDLEIGAFNAGISTTKFDITLLVTDRADGLHIRAQYRSDLFAAATVRRFLGHVRAVLCTAVEAPDTLIGDIQLLSPEEVATLAAANATDADEGPAATALDLFMAQVTRVPERTAVADGTTSATYVELNARADALANALTQAGVSAGQRVGLLLDRSVEAVVALIGIMKAGAAYMPLATEAPAARIALQLRESGATVVIADDHRGLLPVGVQVVSSSGHEPAPAATPQLPSDAAAYVLYTSGSTGTPKGVVITHANIVHYTRAVSQVLSEGHATLDGLHFGFASSLAADLGNTSLYLALASGGTLHMLGKDTTTEPARFADYVDAHPLDVLKITPNHLTALTNGKQGADLRRLMPRKWLVTGGEALRFDSARAFLAAGPCRLLNHYGPTEVTVGACTFEVTTDALNAAEAAGAQTVPVGAPLANTHAYVVDAKGNPMPFGIPGELWLGGAGVAPGYLHRPELTAERFVNRGGERVYRTGDRVRRLAHGPIEFLGRVDHQVKVRGYRVELGEVEHALRAHPGVQETAVLLVTDSTGADALAGYVVARGGGYAVSHNDRPTAEKLIEWLARELPSYMVPSYIYLLDALPLSANGKLDRAALPQPDGRTEGARVFVEPRTATEKQLTEIWAEVLKQDHVGLSDNFLELGGHSLLAIRVLGRISRAFGVRLPLRTLFDAPTVEALAIVIDKEQGAKTPAESGGITARSRDAHRIGQPGGSGSAPTS